MRPVRSISARALGPEGGRDIARALPEEVPVAITCNGTTQAVMMCSPTDLEDFATGFAVTEGFARLDQIERVEVIDLPQGIEARLWIAEEAAVALGARRRAMMGPVGCGLCGIDSLDQALRDLPFVAAALSLGLAEASGAAEALRAHQPLHDQTHAVHAAGFFLPGQGIVMAREDVGRHNALDKLIGAALRAEIDPACGAVVITSRVSVEMVQKTAMFGNPLLIAVSAPTAQALRSAEAAGVSVAAFGREGRLQVFTHPHRIREDQSDVA
ncbi:formate dehydrogenase accessory sulfurtransferase FdhD [Roseicyclus marinus]|uniref:formate dehydrogenase accessory sulfurtransferase FdhD n=1 Tax=Roseicyclus marinus TaxID=2161673 RepID=UPI00240F584A|nr:formate dehydrogenase accessory sulfurtransferase FdhD [Roseicyclus marinus]MDG3042912.1 formate dehydrogenase accessory sulfurtransferase FdhD [Roseicyclus marinus]